MVGDTAFQYATSVSTTLSNLSGVVHTVNDLLSNVSLTASHVSSDVLTINLSVTYCSLRLMSLENINSTTVIPTLNTLTTTSGYLNSCCTNISNICSNLNTSIANVSGRVAILNTSFLNVSNTVDSVLLDNASFMSAFTKINTSFTNVNASITDLKQYNSNVANLNTSVINLSMNFWNLSTVAWGLNYLPAYCTNLSTAFWIDDSKLTSAINDISSVSLVAHNAWDGYVQGGATFNQVNTCITNTSNLLATTNASLANVSYLLGTTNASL